MKREYLKSVVPEITEEQISAILNEAGKDIEASKNALATANENLVTVTTERDGLKTQLSERNNDLAEIQKKIGNQEELENQLSSLQDKYSKDPADLQNKLDSQALSFAAEKFVNGYEFSSEYAKKAVLAEFMSKNFSRDESGNFVGAKDWFEDLKKNSPTAFKVEEPEPTGDPKPRFTKGNEPQPKKVGLSEMMKHKNENPNAKISFEEN